MFRFYVPGAAPWFGGRYVILEQKPGPYEDGGTLAEPAIIRDVMIPAGSEIYVDCDFADITVQLHEPIRVRGVALRAGDRVRFGNRGWIPMFFSFWFLPILPLLLVYLFVRSRFDARDVWVQRDGTFVLAIRPDGSTGPI